MAIQTAAQFQPQRAVAGPQLLEMKTSADAPVVGANAGWRKLLRQAEMVAPYLQIAAIEGEQGVGKQTLARFMHHRSPLARSDFQQHDAREWLATAINPAVLAGFIYLDRVDLLASPGQWLLLGVLK